MWHVATNAGHYADPTQPTGLWLSELTHAWDEFEAAGYEQRILSPAGGASPLEPRALRFPAMDASARRWLESPRGSALLQETAPASEVDPSEADVLYLTGGHGVMFDFTDSPALHGLVRAVFESGGVVASVCHGYCGLLNVRLSDGSYLLADRTVTGFSWREEVLAGVARRVPYCAEQVARDHGARYRKGVVPFGPFVVTDERDGRLVTGQNPASARGVARVVVGMLAASGTRA